MRIVNRAYNRNFDVLERYEAGIALTGAEVKSARGGAMRLEDAYVKIIGNEVHLVNAQIDVYPHSRPEGYDPRRTRKLLLHKKEILRMETKKKQGGRLTIVPIVCYTKGSRIKLEVALVKGRGEIAKKKHEREQDKKRAIQRELKEQMKR